MVRAMTEAIDTAQLQEALSMIDRGLGDLQRRELVSSTEVSDLLLDLRMLLAAAAAEPNQPAGVN